MAKWLQGLCCGKKSRIKNCDRNLNILLDSEDNKVSKKIITSQIKQHNSMEKHMPNSVVLHLENLLKTPDFEAVSETIFKECDKEKNNSLNFDGLKKALIKCFTFLIKNESEENQIAGEMNRIIRSYIIASTKDRWIKKEFLKIFRVVFFNLGPKYLSCNWHVSPTFEFRDVSRIERALTSPGFSHLCREQFRQLDDNTDGNLSNCEARQGLTYILNKYYPKALPKDISSEVDDLVATYFEKTDVVQFKEYTKALYALFFGLGQKLFKEDLTINS